MLLTELFENAEIDLSNDVSQKLIHSDTYNEKNLKRMRFIKVEGIWLHKDIHASTSKSKEESNEKWISSDMPDIPKNILANNVSFNPILTEDILTKIIQSAINIVKEEPLKGIVNSTLTESAQSEVLRNIIQSTLPTIISTKSKNYVVLKNEEYMQNMVATTVSVIQDEPLSKIVDSITTKTMFS